MATRTGSISYSAWGGLLQNLVDLARKGDRMGVYTTLAPGVVTEFTPRYLTREVASQLFHLPPNLDVVTHDSVEDLIEADLKKTTRNSASDNPCYAELFINEITIFSLMSAKGISARFTYKAFHSELKSPYIYSKKPEAGLFYFEQKTPNDIDKAKIDIETSFSGLLSLFSQMVAPFEDEIRRR